MDDRTAAAPPEPPETPARTGPIAALVESFRARVIAGLLLALPIVLTIWIIYYLYFTVQGVFLDPTARLLALLSGGDLDEELPGWWVHFGAPVLGLILTFLTLYLLGYLVRTPLAQALDWLMLRLPLVTTIYRSLRNMFKSLEEPGMGFKRVVLIEFPHPGMRSLAFVTKSLRDRETGQTILCVCLLTGVMPPTGFTLFVNQDDVIDIDWTVRDAIQAIVSGGISVPPIIRYYRGRGGMASTDLLFDASGRPIEPHEAGPDGDRPADPAG